MNPEMHQQQRPTHHRFARLASMACLSLAALFSFVPVTASADEERQMTVASLKGTWQMTLIGQTGCGFGTSLVIFTLDAAGNGMVTAQQWHTAGCGTGGNAGGVPFNIQSLNPDGSGRAGLSCGPSCGWNLIIQVSKDGEMFNVVDVDVLNPDNYIEGTAIRRTTAE